MGRWWKMPLPQGVSDPIFMFELAEHLHMPVGELGRRMSNHELTVLWPAYFASKARSQATEDEKKRGRP